MSATEQILDVTKIAPSQKHPAIFKTFDDLETCESFMIKKTNLSASKGSDSVVRRVID